MSRFDRIADVEPCFALIVAGGSGQRMRNAIPKQFLPLAGRPVLWWTLSVFDRHPLVTHLIVVLPAAQLDREAEIRQEWGIKKPLSVVAGGQQRQESVARGMEAIAATDGLVLVQDGVRPLVQIDLIDRVIRRTREAGAAVPVVPVRNTIKLSQDGWIDQTLPRAKLVAVQTPQGFRLDLLRAAYRQAEASNRSATDDASLVEALGERVAVVEGDERNIKITTPADREIAEKWLSEDRTDAYRPGI